RLPVEAGDGVAGAVPAGKGVAALGPQRARLAVGLAEDVPAAPSAIGRAHGAAQPVVDEAQERRRVALVDAAWEGIVPAERPLVPDVGVDPFGSERREVGARRVAIEPVPADAGPGGGVV